MLTKLNVTKPLLPLKIPSKLFPCLKDSPLQVCGLKYQNLVNGFIEHINSAVDRTPLDNLFSPVATPLYKNGRRIRSLDILGKDNLLLQAISDSIFDVGSITNKLLQKKLVSTPWANGMSGKRLAARITRHLALLRNHGIIKKLPNQHKYYLTEKGKKITSALNIALGASSNDLLKLDS